MSGRGVRATFTGRDLLLAVALAAVVLLVAVVGAQENRARQLERRESEHVASTGAVAVGVAGDLQRALQVTGVAGRDVTAPVPVDPSRAQVPGAVAVRFVSAGDVDDTGVDVLPPGGVDRPIAGVLDRARDSGEPVLSGPVDFDGSPRWLVVAASYLRNPTTGRPTQVVDRRARLVGWVIAPVDLAALARAHLPDGAGATVADGDVVTHANDAVVASSAQGQKVEVGGRELVIRAGVPGGVPLGSTTIMWLVGGGLLAALAGAVALFLRRRWRRLESIIDQRTEQVELIGEVAPLVQQSLELAEVLPAVAVQLTDRFGLAGVAMSTGTTRTGQVGLFSLGAEPDPAVVPVLRPPAHLGAGETLALAMQRGGRSVARLQLVAGRDLDEAELQSLRALTELVTAAVVNAALYASQQEAVRNLRELDALKTVFLGTASHELRTPATAISGFASLLTSSWDRFDETQRRDFVDRIAANARSLGAVVQDLLDFSLLDGGAVSVTLEPIDLPVVVESVVARLSPMLEDHEIHLDLHHAPRVGADVNGIERVVTNLLTNAAKFSPAGTTIAISVGATASGDGAELAVADQGPGIPPEERAQVFTRFYRGSGDAVIQTRGVGIGLSVVAELVGRLGGEVVLDDAPGGGARFTVRLPAYAAPPAHETRPEEADHAPSS